MPHRAITRQPYIIYGRVRGVRNESYVAVCGRRTMQSETLQPRFATMGGLENVERGEFFQRRLTNGSLVTPVTGSSPTYVGGKKRARMWSRAGTRKLQEYNWHFRLSFVEAKFLVINLGYFLFVYIYIFFFLFLFRFRTSWNFGNRILDYLFLSRDLWNFVRFTKLRKLSTTEIRKLTSKKWKWKQLYEVYGKTKDTEFIDTVLLKFKI